MIIIKIIKQMEIHKVKIYSWNVNGIRAVKNKGFLEFIQKEEPDILCLQEIKVQADQLDEDLLNIRDYFSYWNYGERKGYSGVAVYTKTKPVSVDYGFGISKFDSEGRILILNYEKFALLNIYFPNGQMNDERLKYKLEFSEAVLEYCEELRNTGKKIIICGDFNTAHREIDLKNPKANENYSGFLPVERQWLDKLISYGYVDCFRERYPDTIKYTWWSYRFSARQKNIGWRIDYFFAMKDLMPQLEDSVILNEVEGSDHCPIALYMKD